MHVRPSASFNTSALSWNQTTRPSGAISRYSIVNGSPASRPPPWGSLPRAPRARRPARRIGLDRSGSVIRMQHRAPEVGVVEVGLGRGAKDVIELRADVGG